MRSKTIKPIKIIKKPFTARKQQTTITIMNYNANDFTCLNWAPPSFARCVVRAFIMTTWLPIFIALYGIALLGVYTVNYLSTVIIQNKRWLIVYIWTILTLHTIFDPTLWAPTECLDSHYAPNVTGYRKIISMPAVILGYNSTQRYNIM